MDSIRLARHQQPPRLASFARSLKKQMTRAERIFWERVRKHRAAGCHFRRQVVIDRYIVDFYCSELRLVVEIDGPSHEHQRAYDLRRDEALRRLGLRVLRIPNAEVEQGSRTLVDRVLAWVHEQDQLELQPANHRADPEE